MKSNITKAVLALAVAAGLSSCSKNDDTTSRTRGNYILAVTPNASTGVADYLLNVGSLDTGKVSTRGNGLEQDGTYRYYVTHNNKFFSMLYGQGNPGAVTTYTNDGGLLNKVKNFQTETVQAFAPVKDDLLLVKIPRNISSPLANWYRVNTNSISIEGEGTIDVQAFAPKGESAFFSWVKQVGDKVYAPYFTIKGCCGEPFATDYPDSAWVAVFSYPQMQLEKVIRDDRTSFIGRYFTDGLSLAENGDVYAFSSSVAVKNKVITSTKPSAITRIKAGTTEFDKSYYFDVEAASGGYNVTNWMYLGNNNFLVHSATKEEKGAYVAGKTLAIVNVVNKTFTKVTGLPEMAAVNSICTENYSPKDGRTAYVGINLKDGTSRVYKIDATTHTAREGLHVEGGPITTIHHL